MASRSFSAMSLSIFFVAIFISHALASAVTFPRVVPQLRETTYNGGWALGLPSEGCPSDAPVACPAGDINPTCCPFGQTCFGFEQPYCCPTDTDCSNVVNNLPVCANSTWTMWQLSWTGYVCCEPDQIGMNPTSGYAGICQPKGQPVISSLIATQASQIGGPAITTGPGGGAAATAAATATTTDSGHHLTISIGATSTPTSASSSSGSSSILKKIHLSIGELIGIVVGGIILIAALALGVWCCCFKRKRNRTQNTHVEPYRNQGVGGYNNASPYPPAGTAYNAGYTGYAGQRGLNPEGDGVPLTNVPLAGFGQEYKPPVVQSELVYDERSPTVEMGYDERR